MTNVANAETEFPTVDLKTLQDLLMLFHSTNKPLFVWGHPGVAKSAVISKFADGIGALLIDVRLATMEPVELNGLPVPQTEEHCFIWLKAKFLADIPTDRPVVLFFDEWAQAMVPMQNVARQLTYDRKSGDYHLPDNVYVCCASNLDMDRAGTERMPSHVANTFAHVELAHDRDGWLEWAQAEGDIHPTVVSANIMIADCLYDFDPSRKINATYRSWKDVSDIEKRDVSEEIKRLAIETVLPREIATKYQAFRRYASRLIPVDVVLKDPDNAPLPVDADVKWLMTGSLAEVAKPDNLDACCRYFKRVGPEFLRTFMERARLRHGKKIEECEAYGRYHIDRIQGS